MDTVEKVIGRNWQQLTDGTRATFIQIFGNADVCSSAVVPSENHAAHRFTNREFTVVPPDKIWVRAAGSDANIRVVMS